MGPECAGAQELGTARPSEGGWRESAVVPIALAASGVPDSQNRKSRRGCPRVSSACTPGHWGRAWGGGWYKRTAQQTAGDLGAQLCASPSPNLDHIGSSRAPAGEALPRLAAPERLSRAPWQDPFSCPCRSYCYR